MAVCVLVALAVQVWVSVDLPSGSISEGIGTLAGAPLAARLLRLVSFFTIQSNVLSGILSAQLARRPDRDGRGWRVARLDSLFGITVTGIVYSTVLARVHTPNGWRETFGNILVHYVVPVAMVLGWVLFGPRPRITARVVAWSLLWPVVWFGYTLLHGAISGWYPYPFVDVTTHGYLRVVLNAVAVTAVFGLVAALFWLGDRRLRPAPSRTG